MLCPNHSNLGTGLASKGNRIVAFVCEVGSSFKTTRTMEFSVETFRRGLATNVTFAVFVSFVSEAMHLYSPTSRDLLKSWMFNIFCKRYSLEIERFIKLLVSAFCPLGRKMESEHLLQ